LFKNFRFHFVKLFNCYLVKLNSMKITPKQYAESLIEALAEVSKNQRDVCFDNFLKIVDNNGDIGNLPLIIGEIKKIFEDRSGIKQATVTTAVPISEELEQSVAKKLESVFKAKIKLSSAVNPDILGGAIIEFNNEILDESTRAWISGLKQSLNS
jgi:F-type H+-transporting ATPase subunit delta